VRAFSLVASCRVHPDTLHRKSCHRRPRITPELLLRPRLPVGQALRGGAEALTGFCSAFGAGIFLAMTMVPDAISPCAKTTKPND